MSKQPRRDEPEIKPPAPDVKQEPVKPEIPPDKVAPERGRLHESQSWLSLALCGGRQGLFVEPFSNAFCDGLATHLRI
jgi:hypothetical protein